MEALERVQALYTAYQDQFRQMEQARRPGEGVFGLGMGPRDYPCHGQFARDLEQLLLTIRQEGPGSSQARQVLDYICFAPVRRQGEQDAVYWMLMAAHSLTLPLIDLLPAPDAQALLEEYQKAYPRRMRLEAQDKVISALRRRAPRRRIPWNC